VSTTTKISSAEKHSEQYLAASTNVKRSSGHFSAWRTPVAAAALALALGLPAMDAHALALGRVNVLSSIGEPLRAEIDIPDITAEEASTLKTSIASGDAFRAAGLEYNAALASAQLTLQRRPDGRAYLRLTSDRPINEPFVDLILQANWATGRVVRDYTMLFDPPNLKAQAAEPTITAPSSIRPMAKADAPSAPSRATTETKPRVPRSAPAQKAEAAAPAGPDSVKVKAGNTAAQLAARYKPTGVSLDQMLVAMLQTNPNAFIDNNINRLKSGAVLDMPSAAASANGTSTQEAKQLITAQSKDFNEFRRRLASGVPTTSAPNASRKSSGSVEAKVEDRKPSSGTPDKLTLSKGAVAANSASSAAKAMKEEAIAKDKQAKESAARAAELSKNINDLNKLNTTTVAKPGAPAATASSSKGAGVAVATGALTAPAAVASAAVSTMAQKTTSTVAAVTATVSAATATPTISATPTAAPTVTPTVTPIASASPATSDTTTVAAVSTPEATGTVAAAPTPAPTAVPTPEPSFVEGLLGNPLTVPVAGGALALLLAGGGFAMWRKRKGGSQVDSSFLESRLQPDSFFGASGGQRVDTSESGNSVGGAGASSSMVYSPSQLDAAGDVDPVAEADVYLAYGRDLQAEEILKEAMRTNPNRVAVHAKLMEIYAKRRDTKAFETVAKEALNVTQGHGLEWETACALGRDIDPGNPLYQPGGSPSNNTASTGKAAAGMATAGVAALGTAAMGAASYAQQVSAPDPDVDFDLGLDLTRDQPSAPMALDTPAHISTSPIHVQSTSAIAAQPAPAPMVDLAFDMPTMPIVSQNPGLAAGDVASFAKGLDFSAPKAALAAAAGTVPMAMSTAADSLSNPLEFDLGDLSLDLNPTTAPAQVAANAPAEAGMSGDPLETKLALAHEFHGIGDTDAARSLAQEVADEATGALKARAARMVADWS
jgi:pilus assembly protein FimV